MDQFRPREERDPVRDLEKSLEDVRATITKLLKGRGSWLVIGVIVGMYLASGLYIVGPSEQGVVLLFGKVHAVTEPGLRYRLPKPFMTHTVVDVAAVRRAEIGFRSESGKSRPFQAESLMLTGDENIVDVQLFVQYRVNDAIKFLFGADQPEATLRASAEVALRGVVGENTIDYTMTKGMTDVQTKVEAYLKKLLESYNTGLHVTQARLMLVDTPTQVKEAFHEVVRAREDRERLIREAEGYSEDIIPKARGQAKQVIAEAEAYKAQRVIRAQGDSQRFGAVLEEYLKAPKVTRERLYLESAEQFLTPTRKIIMDGQNSRLLPFMPIPGWSPGGIPQSSATDKPSAQQAEVKGK